MHSRFEKPCLQYTAQQFMVRAAGWKKQGVEEALPVKMPVLGLGIANSTDTVTEGNSGRVDWLVYKINNKTVLPAQPMSAVVQSNGNVDDAVFERSIERWYWQHWQCVEEAIGGTGSSGTV